MISRIFCTVSIVLLVSIAEAHEFAGSTYVRDAESLLEQFRQVGGCAIRDATFIIDRALKRLSDDSEMEENYAQSQIASITEGHWYIELTRTKERAKVANVTIDDCLGERETIIHNLFVGFNQLLENFKSKIITEAIAIGDGTLVQVNTFVADRTATFEGNIAECKSWSSTKCLEEVGTAIQRDTLALPSILNNFTTSGTWQIDVLIYPVKDYSSKELLKRKTQGDGLCDEIVKCAEKKIHS